MDVEVVECQREGVHRGLSVTSERNATEVGRTRTMVKIRRWEYTIELIVYEVEDWEQYRRDLIGLVGVWLDEGRIFNWHVTDAPGYDHGARIVLNCRYNKHRLHMEEAAEALESPWEQFTKSIVSIRSHSDGSMPMTMFEQTHILVQKCVKCGKIDKTITRTLS
jgi:hypothetical protein